MKVLVINAGSSSLKYQVIDMDTETMICKGLVERIGVKNSLLAHKKGSSELKIKRPFGQPYHGLAIGNRRRYP